MKSVNKVSNRKYLLSDGGILQIDDVALELMLEYRQEKIDAKEAGGVLLGRFIVDSKNIVVDEITYPFSSDMRERRRFKRGPRHQEIIESRWLSSKGKCNYIGEWHTHPEKYPNPSGIDRRSWRYILKQDVFSSRYLYFLILGTRDFRIWEGDSKNLRIKELKYVRQKVD